MTSRTTTDVAYLASARRAELDRLAASRDRAAAEQNNRMRGRYRRQAGQHERKARGLADAILVAVGAGPL
jgi:hypothetical protein